MTTVPLLEARRLYVSFGGVRAVDDVSLSVEEGEILAIIGQNGAGKSTFLNMCTGYLKPQSGEIKLAGRSIVGMKPRAITRLGVARAFQHPQLFPHRSVLDHLRFAQAAARPGFWNPFRALQVSRDRSQIDELAAFFDLTSLASAQVQAIPEGARKLLDVAMALTLAPKLILLDEPTSGVSSSEKLPLMNRLVAVLRAQNVTAVFVEHDMDVVARFADRVAVWVDGAVFRLGAPDAVLNDPEVKARVL